MVSSLYPIVFIHCQAQRLYGELIQIMEERNSCWIRPLVLLSGLELEESTLLDLRDGPDVICSNKMIQPALDTDWLNLVEKMAQAKSPYNYSQANQHLREFLAVLTVSESRANPFQENSK